MGFHPVRTRVLENDGLVTRACRSNYQAIFAHAIVYVRFYHGIFGRSIACEASTKAMILSEGQFLGTTHPLLRM